MNDPHDREDDAAGLDALLSGMLASDKVGESDGEGAQEPPKEPLLTPRLLIVLGIIAAVAVATLFVLTRPPKQVPVFIDCQTNAVVVYEDVDNPTRYSSDELIRSKAFTRTLETIKNTERGVAVFLVRGKPMRMYWMARSFAIQADCPQFRIDIESDAIIDKAMLDDLWP